MITPMVWQAAERPNFVADTQAMRKRVVAHIPARHQGRELKLGKGGVIRVPNRLLQHVGERVIKRPFARLQRFADSRP